MSLVSIAQGISKKKMSDTLMDLRHLTWSFTKDSPGTAGMFLKSRCELNGKQYFLKMSSFNATDGVYGHECFLEYIASNLADTLGFEHVPYELWYAKVRIDDKEYTTWISASEDYRKLGEQRLSLETFYTMNHEPNESLVDFLMRSEFKDSILKMLMFDYIIYNRDRHSNNIEILYNTTTDTYRMVPMFDHGCSMSSPLYDKWFTMDESYYLSDKPVNNCIGSKSLKSNLQIVKDNGGKLPLVLITEDIFDCIDTVMGSIFCDKHLQLLKERYRYGLDFLNS